ncbi:MAG: hypothetical protein Q8N47_22385 [Bryobacterales bacterium]|nr:hypothetical protein [Bryobacterales bacterium]
MYSVVGIVGIVVSFLLMKTVLRTKRDNGDSAAAALVIAVIFGINAGLAAYFWDPQHPWNPPGAFLNKLVYWIASLFCALAVMRTVFNIPSAGRKALTALVGVVLLVLVNATLLWFLGSPR